GRREGKPLSPPRPWGRGVGGGGESAGRPPHPRPLSPEGGEGRKTGGRGAGELACWGCAGGRYNWRKRATQTWGEHVPRDARDPLLLRPPPAPPCRQVPPPARPQRPGHHRLGGRAP